MRLIIILLLISLSSNAQIVSIKCPEDKGDKNVYYNFALLNDCGFISSKPFINVSFQAGIWTQYVGLFAGYTEYKPKDTTDLLRGEVFTFAFRDKILQDKVTISPFISYNTNKRLDYGLRLFYTCNEFVDIGTTFSKILGPALNVCINL